MTTNDLPISKQSAIVASDWMKKNFQDKIIHAVTGTPYSIELVCAIFCQETAYKLLHWFDKFDIDTILARCVFDASGDLPGHPRSAFPKNAGEFHDKYGDALTDMLIAEGNKQRKMPQPDSPAGYHEMHLLYKGFGIFQFDLQHILTDYDFFGKKLWYSFDECLSRLIRELNQKNKNNEFDMVMHYNGSGPRAKEYAENVMQFKEWAT